MTQVSFTRTKPQPEHDPEVLKKIQKELEKMPSIKQPWPAIE